MIGALFSSAQNGFENKRAIWFENIFKTRSRGRCKKMEKKLTSVSFIYVCVAENAEIFHVCFGKKRKNYSFSRVYVCVKANFFRLFLHLPILGHPIAEAGQMLGKVQFIQSWIYH